MTKEQSPRVLRPEEVSRPSDDTIDDVIERMAIEDHFNAALRRAEKTRQWPARVNVTTANWQRTNIDIIIQRYRDARWVVTVIDDRDVNYTIAHPPDLT